KSDLRSAWGRRYGAHPLRGSCQWFDGGSLGWRPGGRGTVGGCRVNQVGTGTAAATGALWRHGAARGADVGDPAAHAGYSRGGAFGAGVYAGISAQWGRAIDAQCVALGGDGPAVCVSAKSDRGAYRAICDDRSVRRDELEGAKLDGPAGAVVWIGLCGCALSIGCMHRAERLSRKMDSNRRRNYSEWNSANLATWNRSGAAGTLAGFVQIAFAAARGRLH